MAQMLEAAVESIELEHVDEALADLVSTYNDDYAFFQSRCKKVPISYSTAEGSVSAVVPLGVFRL